MINPECGEKNLYGAGQGLSLGLWLALLRIAGGGRGCPRPHEIVPATHFLIIKVYPSGARGLLSLAAAVIGLFLPGHDTVVALALGCPQQCL